MHKRTGGRWGDPVALLGSRRTGSRACRGAPKARGRGACSRLEALGMRRHLLASWCGRRRGCRACGTGPDVPRSLGRGSRDASGSSRVVVIRGGMWHPSRRSRVEQYRSLQLLLLRRHGLLLEDKRLEVGQKPLLVEALGVLMKHCSKRHVAGLQGRDGGGYGGRLLGLSEQGGVERVDGGHSGCEMNACACQGPMQVNVALIGGTNSLIKHKGTILYESRCKDLRKNQLEKLGSGTWPWILFSGSDCAVRGGCLSWGCLLASCIRLWVVGSLVVYTTTTTM